MTMSSSAYRRRRFALTISLALFPFGSAQATWSVIAADQASKRVVIGSATCVSQAVFAHSPFKVFMDIQAVVVPGVGVAAAQAEADPTRANQMLIRRELIKRTDPSTILQQLMADPAVQRRQFAIVDLQGRLAGFSGSGIPSAALYVKGRVVRT